MDTAELPEDLSMMQLADSLFPAGMFAVSNGLESLFQDGRVSSAPALASMIRVCMEQQIGPCDAVALGCAYRSARAGDVQELCRIDAEHLSFRVVREPREAAIRSGVQLARCVEGFSGDRVLGLYLTEIARGRASGTYPVSMGVCCHATGVSQDGAARVLLYGFAASCVGAALRMGMIQHFEGQQVLHGLKGAIAEAAGYAREDASRMWQFAPQFEINQMSHEGRDSNMFAT